MRVIAISVCAAGLLATAQIGAAPASSESPVVSALTYLDVARAGTRVVAVGDRGNILFSEDEGQTWVSAQSPTDALLTSVCFADAKHGWAVGHDAVVLGTADGGETWAVQYSDALGGGAADASADDEDDYDNYDDYDSYDSYDQPEVVDTSGAPFLDVICESADRAMAVGGYGYVVETQDGGTSWQKRNADIPNPDGWHLYAIQRIPNTSTLLIAGEKGTLLRSRDNGVSWQKLKSPYGGTFFGMTVTNNLVLVHGMQGKVFSSRDAGTTWREIKTGVTRAVNDGVVLQDGTIILIGQSGAVLVSHDNGNSVALQYLRNRETVSGVLSLTDGGLLVAGDHGLNVINGIR
ncbi:MAG: YCF48-related protein [Alcanivoracaceae bacterium]|nr:YCF48-related protein [Alcanivoracaceae bacterium]